MKVKSGTATIIAYVLIAGFFLLSAYGASSATTVVAHRIPLERSATVVIDPGHGGIDGGAVSCTGVAESRINLQISLKLKDLFHLLGFQTRMIRTDDRSVHTGGDTIAAIKVSDLRQRVRWINETENALLISIHQNTFPDSSCWGPQVFFDGEGKSEHLAKKMQERLNQACHPSGKRTAKKAEGVYLMQHVHCTAVLVECGFLSNPEEEAMLRSKNYQQHLCCVIAAAAAGCLDA